MTDTIKVKVQDGHQANFTEDGVRVTKTAADLPFKVTKSQFEELALFGAVRRATREDEGGLHPLDHDGDGDLGGSRPRVSPLEPKHMGAGKFVVVRGETTVSGADHFTGKDAAVDWIKSNPNAGLPASEDLLA